MLRIAYFVLRRGRHGRRDGDALSAKKGLVSIGTYIRSEAVVRLPSGRSGRRWGPALQRPLVEEGAVKQVQACVRAGRGIGGRMRDGREYTSVYECLRVFTRDRLAFTSAWLERLMRAWLQTGLGGLGGSRCRTVCCWKTAGRRPSAQAYWRQRRCPGKRERPPAGAGGRPVLFSQDLGWSSPR